MGLSVPSYIMSCGDIGESTKCCAVLSVLLTIIRKCREISVSVRKSFWIVKLTTIDFDVLSINNYFRLSSTN